MDYKVVICSHNRVGALRKKTIQTLERYGIPKDKVFLFVAPEEEKEYVTAFPDYTVCLGALGLPNQRNAVRDYFEPDEYLFCLDDDITGFWTVSNQTLIELDDLDSFIRYGFQTAAAEGCSLWGFYPVKNAKWLKPKITKGLVFCYGCAFGLINKKDITIELALKEDFERSLKFYLRDRKTLRFNWVCPQQSYRKGKGGLSELRTLERESEECDKLVSSYPSLCKKKVKEGRVEVVLKRNLCSSIDERRPNSD